MAVVQPMELHKSAESIMVYLAFKEQIHVPKSVLYPGCWNDKSPSEVFSNVTYVDLDETVVQLFKKHGLKAHAVNIEQYSPTEEHDLLILQNFKYPNEIIKRHLKAGGYIISDQHGGARSIFEDGSFRLVAAIDLVENNETEERKKAVVSTNIEGLFEPVKDGEELRRLRPEVYQSIAKAYPHMLRQRGEEPGRTFEETYWKFQRMIHGSKKLPSKRDADKYIFVKK